MSELTPCNYCTFRDIRARAKRDGKKAKTKLNAKDGGIDVLVDNEKVCWFMELTPFCCC